MKELDYWNGRLLKGAVSRREFMGRAAALGASSLAISTMLASADARADETPKKGGVLRLGLGGGSTTDSIDITSYNNSVMIDTSHGLFDGIVEWGQDGRPHPDLAESWEPKNGAKDWIFNLRKGINFSNGKEFTADDAIYSLNLHRGDTKSGGASTFKPVTDIKKLDTYQIQISLNGPDADLPYALTDYHVHMVPDGFKDWSKPVGTGAFSLDKFDPGVRISLKKTRDYWKAGSRLARRHRGHGHQRRLGAAQRADLRPDRRDQSRGPQSGRPARRRAPKLQVVRASGGWHAVMAMQCDKAPFDNPDIRMAMKLATDREQILKALFSGYGTVGNDHPIPPNDPYFNKDLPQRKYDPDKAAAAFKKAGLTDPKISAASLRRGVQRRRRRGRAPAGQRQQGGNQG